MNPKYTTAGLAFGLLVALAPDTALAQNPKPQVRQKASTRSASPAPQTTDNNPADLPIGVLQGMEDAKRYQELVRRAAREGQPAPPLPYAAPTPRPAAVPPAGAAYTLPSGVPTAPSRSEVSGGMYTVTSPYQPVVTPAMVPVPANRPQATQYLQSPMQPPIRPDMTFGQARPQPTTPQPSEQDLNNLREQIEALYNTLHHSGDFGIDLSSPSLPVASPPSRQPISMPGPGPRSLPFGRKP
ncbi:hypothetical protein J8C01_02200 [Chloracidobacterium sp. D]|uniref:hypothetical protein n=1 Tax=Chloracidobacterium sp. D TaxID=2821536 RepID=UPI001B8AEDA8|nr:hypothetical protein [Chloracidobacterium sp. D]QUV82162.1 hypothetical protein J8C01_02200 [Chloracidobacterium sp. D]